MFQRVTLHASAFLLDPDGNSAEAVHAGEMRVRGAIDPPVDPRRRRGGG